MTVALRPIRAEDDAAVAAIIREVMREHDADGPGFAIVDPEVDHMSAAYDPSRTPPGAYFVLEEHGRVVGGAGIGPLTGGDGATCELRKMYVLASHRGGGHGRALLHRCLDEARRLGYRRCYLETLGTMARARALYEAAGFSRLEAAEGRTGHFGCNTFYALNL